MKRQTTQFSFFQLLALKGGCSVRRVFRGSSRKKDTVSKYGKKLSSHYHFWLWQWFGYNIVLKRWWFEQVEKLTPRKHFLSILSCHSPKVTSGWSIYPSKSTFLYKPSGGKNFCHWQLLSWWLSGRTRTGHKLCIISWQSLHQRMYQKYIKFITLSICIHHVHEQHKGQ